MYKVEQELRNQFNSIELTRIKILEQENAIRAFFSQTESLCVLGCGSSYSIAKSSALQFSQWSGLPATAIAAGDLLVNFEAYKTMLQNKNLLLLSRSGSTSEVVLAVERCRKQFPQMKIASICAVADAPVAALADLNLEIPWAFDRSICQTQTVSNLYMAALMLCGIHSGADTLLEAIAGIGAQAPAFCASVEDTLSRLAKVGWNSAVVLADSGSAGLAEEGALAFKEICQRPSNCYHVLDARHGPMVLFGEDTLAVILLSRGDAQLQADLVNDVAGRVHSLLVLEPVPVDGIAPDVLRIRLPPTPFDDVSAIFALYCMQVLCFKHALHCGVNPDQPKDLASWIRLDA